MYANGNVYNEAGEAVADMNQSLSYVYTVPTILDAWAQIAYQQILASLRTLRPCRCVECVWAHISDIYYDRG